MKLNLLSSWRLTNHQLLVSVRDDNGSPVNSCFSSGSGEKLTTDWKSIVLYKCGNPVWKETIRVEVPVQLYPRSHLFFTFQVAPLAQ